MPESTTRLTVREQFLDCFTNGTITWRIQIAAILLIAEYTTNEGPFVDDYFVELWSLENGSTLKAHATVYCTGRDAAFTEMAKQLDTALTFGLTGSIEWTSRIMWPPELAGHPYFEFRDVKPPNWREKISRRFRGPAQEYFLTEEVQAFLKNRRLGRSNGRE
jgi:hypothetical protein